MRDRTSLVAALSIAAGGTLAASAGAQQFVNGDFETGTLAGWTVQATANGQTLEQGVVRTDIDSAGPLFPGNAACFRVGQVVATGGVQEGIELFQTLNLTAGQTYSISLNWFAARDFSPNNSEGGLFTIFIEGTDLATAAAGSTSTTPVTGSLEVQHAAGASGPHRVGVRITRPFTVTPALGLTQRIDNFFIGPALPGACCVVDGTCAEHSHGACANQGGQFHGAGTQCALISCPPAPTGGCCAGGACSSATVSACVSSGGVYLGDGAPCPALLPCPQELGTTAPTTSVQTAFGGAFFDLAGIRSLRIPRLDYYANVSAGTGTTVQVWTRPGTYLGNDGSIDGWFHHETVNTVSAGPAALAAVQLRTPLTVGAGETLGVCLIAYAGGIGVAASPPTTTFADPNLSIFTDRTRTQPFGGVLSTSRAWGGRVHYVVVNEDPPACYPNCDGSTTVPVLNVADFTCFLQRFAAGEAYANCDQSTVAPVLNVADFTCFLQSFAAGCP